MKEKEREIVSRVEKREERVVTTVVVLSEVANVVEALTNLTTSLEVVENIMDAVEVRDVRAEDYMEALLVAKRMMVSVNDALAYVVMGIKEIYTFDKHFRELDVVVLP